MRSPRAGAALLVAVTLGFAIVKYPAVFRSLDNRAAANSHAPDRQLAGAVSVDISRSFLLAARRLLPEHARYTVAVGPNVQVSNSVVLGAVSQYAEFWLLPRRKVDPQQADWLLCYGCDLSAFRVSARAWDEHNGLVIARLRR